MSHHPCICEKSKCVSGLLGKDISRRRQAALTPLRDALLGPEPCHGETTKTGTDGRGAGTGVGTGTGAAPGEHPGGTVLLRCVGHRWARGCRSSTTTLAQVPRGAEGCRNAQEGKQKVPAQGEGALGQAPTLLGAPGPSPAWWDHGRGSRGQAHAPLLFPEDGFK